MCCFFVFCHVLAASTIAMFVEKLSFLATFFELQCCGLTTYNKRHHTGERTAQSIS